jgi:hypothetical protein
MNVTKVEDVPSLVEQAQVLIEKHHGDAVDAARSIGELLAFAKNVLRGKYQKWAEDNIKLTDRMVRNYKRLFENWHLVEVAKGNGVFGNSDDQYRYTIVGCLKCISNGGKKPTKKKKKAKAERRLRVEADVFTAAAKKAKVSQEAAELLLRELGYKVEVLTPA